jgi:hypothetical protein
MSNLIQLKRPIVFRTRALWIPKNGNERFPRGQARESSQRV